MAAYRPGFGQPFGNPFGGSVPTTSPVDKSGAAQGSSAQLGIGALGDFPLGGPITSPPPLQFSSTFQFSSQFSGYLYSEAVAITFQLSSVFNVASQRFTQYKLLFATRTIDKHPAIRVTQYKLLYATRYKQLKVLMQMSVVFINVTAGISGRFNCNIQFSSTFNPSGSFLGSLEARMQLSTAFSGSGRFLRSSSCTMQMGATFSGSGAFAGQLNCTLAMSCTFVGPTTAAGIEDVISPALSGGVGAGGVALSGGPYLYTTFSTSSDTVLRDTVISSLAAVGWVDVGASANTTGRRVRATSPQGLTVDVDIWAPGNGLVFIQFKYPIGHVQQIAPQGAGAMEIIAHPCQFFVATVGTSGGDRRTVCGGIPFVPNVGGGLDACGAVGVGGDPTTECWWSNGDYQGDVIGRPAGNLRLGLDVSGSSTCDGSYNDNYCAPGGGGSSRVLSFSMDTTFLTPGVPSRYPDGAPLIVAPLIGWGDSQNGAVRVRGQLWDAMTVCSDFPLEDTTSVFGTKDYEKLDQAYTWINYVSASPIGSVYLITSKNRPRSAGLLPEYVKRRNLHGNG